jgi:starch-binding outer membrane protein, SusD/RagB family
MKILYNISWRFLLIFALFPLFISCEKNLEPEIFDQLSPGNFFKTRADVNAAVIGIYAELGKNVEGPVIMGQWGTDEYRNNEGGSESVNMFEWRESTNSGMYFLRLPAVTRAGATIEVVRDLSFLKENDKNIFLSELRTLRAIFMFDLLRWYGPAPVVTDKQNLMFPDNNFKPARPDLTTAEGIKFYTDYITFIETELLESASYLPEKVSEFGRMNKGIAQTMLLKLYMHQKNWSKAEQISKSIMELNQYALVDDYNSIWSITNEQNKEIIFAIPRTSNTLGQTFRTRTLKTEYNSSDETKWNMDKVRFDFLDTFDPADVRKTNIIDKFENRTGKKIDMRDEALGFYGAFSLKYGRDPDARQNSGVDVIYLRYADVLLSRAEAINELQGPTAEAVGLINQIRVRAGLSPILIESFDKASLRDHILAERGWEFWMEGLRRDDMIRHGKYISSAQARGAVLARDHHILYPIPHSAIVENENIKQNPGYAF